jgi:uncharacterized protein (DUF2249 family)
MILNANTKIAAVLKGHPGALEAIISISPKFTKLRNPILRKLMAGRTSLAMAAKVGGCSMNDFFEKLQPLGFKIDKSVQPSEINDMKAMPELLKDISPQRLISLDVRPILAAGADPLTLILGKIKELQEGQVLEIINTFEPRPLMGLLKKQGFNSYAAIINDSLVKTYFYKEVSEQVNVQMENADRNKGWKEALEKYTVRMEVIDVRELEMPKPMMTILESLDKLAADKALFVHHKRIPVFLLPELSDRSFDYRINEIAEGYVQLLIFKP